MPAGEHPSPGASGPPDPSEPPAGSGRRRPLEFLRLVAAAIAFLTRLPAAGGAALDAKTVARSARFFPLAGALVGAICAGALLLLARAFPPLLAAALAVALDAALTGAMHYDGLADSADGLGGGRTAEAALRIMRDPVVGSYGVAAVVLAAAVKIAALAALIETGRIVAGLLVAPAMGRWAAVLLGATLPYARPENQATRAGAPTRFIGRKELAIATILAAALALGVAQWRGAAALVLSAALAAAWGSYCRRRIGGVTGDTLGAAIQLAECAVLVLFAARWR